MLKPWGPHSRAQPERRLSVAQLLWVSEDRLVHSWRKSPGPHRPRLQPTSRPPGRRLKSAPQSTHVPRGSKPRGQLARFIFFNGTKCAQCALERPSFPDCPLRQAAGLEARRAVPGRLRALPPPPEHLTRSPAPGVPGQEAVRQGRASASCGRSGTAPHPVPVPALSAAQTQKPPWLQLQPRWPPDPCRDPGCTHWRSSGSGSRGGGGCSSVLAAAAAAPLRPQLSQLWPPVRLWHPQSLPRLPRPPPFPTSSSIVCAAVSRERNTFLKKRKKKKMTPPPTSPSSPPHPSAPSILPFHSPLPAAASERGPPSLAGLAQLGGGRGDQVLPGLGFFVLG